MHSNDCAVDTGTQGVNMAVDLRVVGGLVGLQVVPRRGRDGTRCEKQQRHHRDSPGVPLEPEAVARGATLLIGSARYLDAPETLVAAVLLESFEARSVRIE